MSAKPTVSGPLRRAPTAPIPTEPLRLAGVLPLPDSLAARWPWSGAWTRPVGDSWDPGGPGTPDEPAWRTLRGFAPGTEGHHEGADFGNGRAGDAVRAAAHGLVVLASAGPGGGHGSHVVLAHRLREGGFAYSVYSHLLAGSIRVREGQRVWAGTVLAEIGRSGRATTDHLHFEVRLTREPEVRWERVRAVDPAAYLEQRLPAHQADSSWAGPYLDWADRAGLIEAIVRPAEALSPGTWHVMLARAARLASLALPASPAALESVLAEQEVLANPEPARAGRAMTWAQVTADLAQLARAGTRLPPAPLQATAHRARCLARFGRERPALEGPAPRFSAAPPTVADACVLLADLTVGDTAPGPQDPPGR